MLIFTNRAYDPGQPPIRRFTCHFNSVHPDAFVAADLDETSVNIIASADTPAAQADLFVERCLRTTAPRKTLLYMHGFNNSVEDVYKRARAFEALYNVEVIAITWPSEGVSGPEGITQAEINAADPETAGTFALSVVRSKGNAERYLQARKNARVTALAVEALLGEITRAWGQHGAGPKPTLAVHSLGNFVLQNALSSNFTIVDVDAFANVVLLAPDVDGVGHGEWLKQAGKFPLPGEGRARVIATVNRNDWVLAASNAMNRKQRLGIYGFGGQHITNESYNAIYLDVTGASKQAAGHSYFVHKPSLGSGEKPKRLRRVLDLALRGEPLPTIDGDLAKSLYGDGIHAYPPIADVERVPGTGGLSSEDMVGGHV